MKYHYEALTPDRFQDFAQALLVAQFPDLRCFPVGQKDGGRDASTPAGGSKDGIVFQAKFRRELLKGEDYYAWLTSSIKKEQVKIDALIARGLKQYVLITNVPGTSAQDSGSMDRVQKFLDDNLSIPATCMWRQDLDARLDNEYNLKWSYSEIINSRDMLRMMLEMGLGDEQARRSRALRAFMQTQYKDDGVVKFKQADLHASRLLDLFIDVPARPMPSAVSVSQRFAWDRVAQSMPSAQTGNDSEEDQFLYREPGSQPIGAASALLDPQIARAFPQIVIQGAPGQGKSTLAQYLCQVNRMRLLGKDEVEELPAQHRSQTVRIPLKVDLRDFARWLQGTDPFSTDETVAGKGGGVRTLETFLAALIEHGSGGQKFDASDVAAIADALPILLVLDGLDEVAAAAERTSVAEAITAGVRRLSDGALAFQAIVTSRPVATASSPAMPPKQWSYITLEAINRDLIIEYMGRWSRARRLDERDTQDIRSILISKLSNPHMSDLSRNPMQLTIGGFK